MKILKDIKYVDQIKIDDNVRFSDLKKADYLRNEIVNNGIFSRTEIEKICNSFTDEYVYTLYNIYVRVCYNGKFKMRNGKILNYDAIKSTDLDVKINLVFETESQFLKVMFMLSDYQNGDINKAKIIKYVIKENENYEK